MYIYQLIVLLVLSCLNCVAENHLMQHPLSRTSVSYHVKTSVPPSFTSFPFVTSTPQWPRQDDPITSFNQNDLGVCAPVVADTTVAPMAPMPLQCDFVPPGNVVWESYSICHILEYKMPWDFHV